MVIKEIIGVVDHYFRPLIIVLSTAITILLSSKKIGNKVSAHYKVVSDTLSHPRIDDIVLINYKDKPVPIFGVYALFDKEYLLELEICDPPIVIEPYGSVSIKTKAFSKLYIGEHEYEPDYFKATILLDSVDEMIKCKSYKRNLAGNKEYRQISKSTVKFNEIVHDGRNPFALAYVINGEYKTAFISSNGILMHEWNFTYNGIDLQGRELDENIINDFLIQCGYADSMTNYAILKLINGNYSTVLNKSK
ncbi:hypothetical protein ACOUXA_00070 [Acinetobacter baumannii]